MEYATRVYQEAAQANGGATAESNEDDGEATEAEFVNK